MNNNTDDLVSLLRRTNELLLVIVKAQMKDILKAELSNKKKKQLYELTGTSIPIKKISEMVGVSTGAISTIWKNWEYAGLIIKDGKTYRRTLG
jgi:predicted transcriptional regulator